MDKLISKEEEVGIKEIIKNKMEEGNQEDRTEVPVIKETPEDNLKDNTVLSPTEENLDPNPTKDNIGLNQNKTAEIKANQKKE